MKNALPLCRSTTGVSESGLEKDSKAACSRRTSGRGRTGGWPSREPPKCRSSSSGRETSGPARTAATWENVE